MVAMVAIYIDVIMENFFKETIAPTASHRTITKPKEQLLE